MMINIAIIFMLKVSLFFEIKFNTSFIERYASWTEAQIMCRNIGGYLAEVKTIDEHFFLVFKKNFFTEHF